MRESEKLSTPFTPGAKHFKLFVNRDLQTFVSQSFITLKVTFQTHTSIYNAQEIKAYHVISYLQNMAK